MRNKYIPYIILFILVAVIAYTNIQPGTIFSGWDNLHPEFNIPLNLQRAIFGVWQGHEGLGHTGGHGYASTLPHTLIIWFLSLFLPMSYLRYTFTFLALLVGSIGTYQLIVYLLKNKGGNTQRALALVGSVFYMLNFGTVGQFALQLEAFIIHFVALPWSIYFILSLLDHWNRKKYFIFLIFLFFTSTQGFIPPLFIAYMLIICALLLASIFFYRTRDRVTSAITLFVSIALINAYWLLPVIHYSLTQSREFLNAYNNILSTNSWTLTNNKYGTVQDLAILRGFPIQARTETPGLPQTYVFQPWMNHFTNFWIQSIGYIFFGIIIMGCIYFAYRNKNCHTIALTVVSLLFFSILAARIPFVSNFSTFLQEFPAIKQAFRTGFTKLSISLSLFYSVYLVFGLLVLKEIFHRFLKTSRLLVLSAFIGIIVFSYPIFRGNFLYSGSRISIPKAYEEVFDFFKNQSPSARITTLPQGEQWGWSHYRWGYVGSGFLWFGLPQPVMERAFDVWKNANENYYWELSYALYSQNRALLENVLEKYQISWILFDTSFIPYSNGKSVFAVEKIERMLDTSSKFELVRMIPIKNPQNDSMRIYKVHRTNSSDTFINPQDLPKDINPYQWDNDDRAFSAFGPYWSDDSTKERTNDSSFFFPFRSLFTGRKQEEREFTLMEDENNIKFVSKIPKGLAGKTIFIPKNNFFNLGNQKESISILIDQKNLEIPNNNSEPSALTMPAYTDGRFEVYIPKFTENSFDSASPGNIIPDIRRCDDNTEGKGGHSIITEVPYKIYHLENTDSGTCADWFIENLPHKLGYLVTIESTNIQGTPLLLQIINGTSRRTDMTIQLSPDQKKSKFSTSYVILPPMEPDGLGYSLRFSNISIGPNRTENDIGRITIYPVPYDFLKNIAITYGLNVRINFQNDRQKILTFSQAYDPGWIALQRTSTFPYYTPLTDHVLVNNWANGWKLDGNEENIVIFFWPQLLEWIGFALLPIPFVLALKKKTQ